MNHDCFVCVMTIRKNSADCPRTHMHPLSLTGENAKRNDKNGLEEEEEEEEE